MAASTEPMCAAHGLPIGRSLQHLATAWGRALGQRLSEAKWPIEAGFRPGCVGLLLSAERLGSASQRDIGAELGLDPSDVVGLVDTLERAGLVARERDVADRRRHALVVTPLGRRRATELRAIVAEVDESMLAPLGKRKQDTFVALVDQLTAAHRRP